MGVLSDIETTLKNSDVSLIKTKLFTNLCRSCKTNDCVAFSIYELINLDLSIDEIQLLIQHDVCRSHAVLSKIYPTYDTAITFVSDINLCKLYMHDPNEFYKRYGIETDKLSKLTNTVLTSNYMGENILSCMIVFDIQTQQEFSIFRDTQLEKQWKTDMSYLYSIPPCI